MKIVKILNKNEKLFERNMNISNNKFKRKFVISQKKKLPVGVFSSIVTMFFHAKKTH